MSMLGPAIQDMIIAARDRQRMADFNAAPRQPIPGMNTQSFAPPPQSFMPAGTYGQQAAGLLGQIPSPTPAPTGGLLSVPPQPAPQTQMIPGFFGSRFQFPLQGNTGTRTVPGFFGSSFQFPMQPENPPMVQGGFMGSRFRGK